MTWDVKNHTYKKSEVVIVDKNPEKLTEFLEIHLANHCKLQLTYKHYVYVKRNHKLLHIPAF